MRQDQIQAAIEAAFYECERILVPLTEGQKRILLQVIVVELRQNVSEEDAQKNPLDELTPQERDALLQFVQEQEQQNRPWKIQLLNDWLHNRNSGSVQFIRDSYGAQWLNRVKPVHLAYYFDQFFPESSSRLKIGDRIEVCNRLWEWVQPNDPKSQEWFPCNVIGLFESADRDCTYTHCIIRFDNGTEFEIQGIYQWNQYNWRRCSFPSN